MNVDSDRLSEHASVETARKRAAMLAAQAVRSGQRASVVDLSRTCEA